MNSHPATRPAYDPVRLANLVWPARLLPPVRATDHGGPCGSERGTEEEGRRWKFTAGRDSGEAEGTGVFASTVRIKGCN
jgi:hypothetical protein